MIFGGEGVQKSFNRTSPPQTVSKSLLDRQFSVLSQETLLCDVEGWMVTIVNVVGDVIPHEFAAAAAWIFAAG